MWRYVSTGRRGAGWAVFLALVSAMYLYWYMTNPRHVRDMAQAYLETLTGLDVRVDSAQFNLFGPIELVGVRVYTDNPATTTSQPASDAASGPASAAATRVATAPAMRGGGPWPLLKADKVILRHQPLSLLIRRRVRPTDIIFVQPEITIEHYASDGASTPEYEYNFQQIFRGRSDDPPSSVADLPRIRVQNCRLNSVEVVDTARVAMTATNWNITILPEAAGMCRIIIDPVADPATNPLTTHTTQAGQVQCLVDLTTGRIEGDVTIGILAEALPQKYRQWCQRFKVAGSFRIAGKAHADTRSALTLELLDVTLSIPPAQAALTLSSVRGTVSFEESGVRLQNVSGRILETGGSFLLDGHYEGYAPDSKFDLAVTLRAVTVPEDKLPGESRLAVFLDALRRWYSPEGTADIDASLRRDDDGKLQLTGVANLNGMSITHRSFPYTVHDVRGRIRFDTARAVFERLTCRRGPGRATIVGTAGFSGGVGHDVTITAEDVPCDADLLAALPQRWHNAWEAVDPGGRFDATVHVLRTDPEESTAVHVDINPDGQLTLAYKAFPYRIALTGGRIRFRKDLVALESLRGARGTMQCRIDGIISALGSENAFVDITAETRPAAPMPIDDALIAAMPPNAAKAVRELHASGQAALVARITQSPKQPLTYRARATLRNVTFQPEVFPYRITDGTGDLDITPEQILVTRFLGHHDTGAVQLVTAKPARDDFPSVPMRIDLTGKAPAVYLSLKTGPLPLDNNLRAALPDTVRKIWDQFTPSGNAELTGLFWSNTPEHGPVLHYDLDIRARGVNAVYEKLPHPLTNLSGRIHAVPGTVTLKDLVSPAPPAPADATGRENLSRPTRPAARLGGTVTYSDTDTRVALNVHAAGVGVSREILEALPEGTQSILRHLRPGGTCDVDLKTLRVEVFDARDATASAPARPQRTTWTLDGRLAFHDGVLVLGPQTQTFSGSLEGKTLYDGTDTDITANLAVDRVRIGSRQMANLQAAVRKATGSSLVKLQDFSAEVYAGRLAGLAELRLTDPVQYGVSLSVNDVQLADLVRGETDPDTPLDVSGLLTGNIQLTGTMGKPDSARATGIMQIDKGKLYRLPVMLGLLQVVTLGLPGDAAFTEGNVTYRLEGNTLRFDEIYLSGPSLTIVGTGTLDLKTRQVRLRFVSSAQRKLPRLALLDELLRAPFRELMEIHIDGPLDDPKIKTVSLVSLDAFLKQLLRPELNNP